MKIVMMKQNFCTEGGKQGVRMVQDQSSWLIRVIKFTFSGCFIISSWVFLDDTRGLFQLGVKQEKICLSQYLSKNL